MAVYYPRQGFAKYLGNDKALLDYLDWIKMIPDLIARIEALEGVVGGYLQVPGGEFFLLPGGDPLSLPG